MSHRCPKGLFKSRKPRFGVSTGSPQHGRQAIWKSLNVKRGPSQPDHRGGPAFLRHSQQVPAALPPRVLRALLWGLAIGIAIGYLAGLIAERYYPGRARR
jgi:hypothetical protein